jgi:hypothetical protein
LTPRPLRVCLTLLSEVCVRWLWPHLISEIVPSGRLFCTMKLFLILDVFAWLFLYLLSYRISLTTILTTIVNSTTKRKPSYQVNTISVNYKLRGREHGLPFGVCDLEYHYLTSFLWLQAIGDGLIDSQVLEMWYMSMYLSDPICL